jgi:hypothetical protein
VVLPQQKANVSDFCSWFVESQSAEDVDRKGFEFGECCVESNELKKATIWMRL